VRSLREIGGNCFEITAQVSYEVFGKRGKKMMPVVPGNRKSEEGGEILIKFSIITSGDAPHRLGKTGKSRKERASEERGWERKSDKDVAGTRTLNKLRNAQESTSCRW